MADRTLYPCRIVTPEGVLFDDPVQQLTVTGVGGQIGMLARHAPIVAHLKTGHASVQLEDGTWRTWATREGFAKVHDSTGLVIVEDAGDVEEIDLDDVTLMIDEAKVELERVSTQGDDEIFRADAEAAQQTIEWGEHLRALHAKHHSG